MQLKNAIKKLKKNGYETKVSHGLYTARKINSSDLIEFRVNGRGSELVTGVRVRSESDRDEAMIDYHAGVWCKNISQAIAVAE